MPKKLNSLEDLATIRFENLVANPDSTEETAKDTFQKQFLEAHFSKKGRGGKTVTIIKGFEGSQECLNDLAASLKKKLSVGGTVKNNEIIIQGNYRDALIKLLNVMGHEVKRIGG